MFTHYVIGKLSIYIRLQ